MAQEVGYPKPHDAFIHRILPRRAALIVPSRYGMLSLGSLEATLAQCHVAMPFIRTHGDPSATHVHNSLCSSAAFFCAAAAAAGFPRLPDRPLPLSPAAAAATAAALSLLISRFCASRSCPLSTRTCKLTSHSSTFNLCSTTR
jgi:hypothetical protein